MPDLLPDRFPSSFTSSMLADLVCPHRFYLRYVHRLSSEETSIHLAAGDAFAKGLQRAREAFFIDGLSEQEALGEGLRTLLVTWPFDEAKEHTRKPLDRVAMALEGYVDTHPFAHDRLQPALLGERHAIEFSFALPLPVKHPDTDEPILYEGRCDMIGEYEGSVFVTDEKTTTQLGEQWSSRFRLRGQFIGYTMAALEHGFPVAGTFVRGVAIRKTGIDFAQTVHLYPPYMIADWFATVCKRIEYMKQCWQTADEVPSRAFPRVYSSPCEEYGGCLFVDRCASREPESVSGFKQTENLYFEK